MPQLKPQSGWLASLELEFSHTPARTVISHKAFQGPLVVQKPFYPEAEVCHVYLIHPPGGIVGGDRLQLDIRVGEAAHSVITTPAANKFYRSDNVDATLRQQLRVADRACLEYLPQETIFFDRSHSDIRSEIHLAREARFMTWDILCLGRPAAGEYFQQGRLWQGLEIYREEQRILSDRLFIENDSPLLRAPWGLAGFPVMAYLIITPADTDMRDALRRCMSIEEHHQLSVSLIKNLLVCRYLGYHAEQARKMFTHLWEIVRPMLVNKVASIPRIWAS